MAQQSTVITCNLNSPNPPFRHTQSDFSRLREVHFCREICPPCFAAPVHQLREPLKCWWIAAEQFGFFFPWEKHSAKAQSITERGIGVWTIPKQQSPTCQQGLLKYNPETGQLKLAVRQSQVSCKSQASKCSREQSEKKKLSLGVGILESCQAILQHDFQSCERDFLLLHNHPSTVQSTSTDLLPLST